MAISITASGEAKYTVTDVDEEFTTSEIKLIKEESNTVSSGYQEESLVIVKTYQAESDHGNLEWENTT